MVVMRTIKNGRVRINGRVFHPDRRYLAYDGRLDGMRCAFALYEDQPRLASLWGTEMAYRFHFVDNSMIVDDIMPWAFWYTDAAEEV